MKKFNSKLYGNDLKLLRKDRTQQEFAKEIETNRSTLSNLETGKQEPTMDQLAFVCEKLDKNQSDYFEIVNNDPIVFMMGKISKEDGFALENVIERIRIKSKYIALLKRCEK